MSASHTFAPDPRFPVGTALSVWPGEHRRMEPGPAAFTSSTIASDRTVTFTGLEYDTRYTAAARVGGLWLSTLFTTREAPAGADALLAVNLHTYTNRDGTDDTEGFNEALLTALLLGVGVHDQGGTYRIDGEIEWVSGVSVTGKRGASVLDFSHRSTYGTEADPLIAGRGDLSAAKTLSGDHAAGATTLTSTTAHDLAVGNLLLASSDRLWTGDSLPNEHGELGVVLTVPTSTTVTLSSGLLDFYDAADNAYIQKVTPIENVTIEGFKVIGRGTPGAATAGDWGIRFEYGRNIHVRDCDFDGVDQCCVELLSVYEGSIEGCTFYFDKTPDEVNVQYGARVSNASQFINVLGNSQTNGRHCVNCGHDRSFPGVQRMILIEGNHATGTWHAGFSTHNNCEHVRFVNNFATGCRYGVNLRAKHCSVTGGELRDCGTGVILTVKPEHVKVDDVDIWGCDAGIGMTSTLYQDPDTLVFHEPEHITISNNRLRRCGTGITLSAADSIATKKGWRIVDNQITIVTTDRAISINGPFSGTVRGNVINDVQDATNGDGIRLRGTRGMVVERNVIDTCGAYGIRLMTITFNGGLGTAESVANEVRLNKVRGFASEGAIVDSSTTGTNMIEVRPRELAADDATDFYAAIQACFNVGAANGWTVRFDPGNYPITDTPVLASSNVTIKAWNATIDGSAIAAAGGISTRFALKVQGTVGSGLVATGALTARSATGPFPTATLAAGDMGLLASSTELYMDGVSGATEKRQQLLRVRSVDSGSALTFTEGVRSSYLTGATTTFKKITPVTGLEIHGLKILMGGAAKLHNGILLQRCEKPVLRAVKVDGCEDTGIQFSYCYGGHVSGGQVQNANYASTGYGTVCVDATRDVLINNAYSGRNCRHAVTSGSCASNIRVSHCDFEGNGTGSGASLDCHEATFSCSFDHNRLSGGLNTGILLRGQDARAEYNRIRNMGASGVHVTSFDTNTDGLAGAQVIGNDIDGCGSNGIKFEGTATCRVKEAYCSGNRIRNVVGNCISTTLADDVEFGPGDYGTITSFTGTGGNSIQIVGASAGSRCQRISITGGSFKGFSSKAVKADFCNVLTINAPTVNTSDIALTSCVDAVRVARDGAVPGIVADRA